MDSKKSTSTKASSTLFEILKSYGGSFPREFWKRILHEIFKPIFERSDQNKNQVRKNSITGGMDVQGENQPLREMFSQLMDIHDYYKSTLEFFSKDILDLLADCSTQSSETVAKLSINSMRFLIDNGTKALLRVNGRQ